MGSLGAKLSRLVHVTEGDPALEFIGSKISTSQHHTTGFPNLTQKNTQCPAKFELLINHGFFFFPVLVGPR